MKCSEDDKRTREQIHAARIQRLSEPIKATLTGHIEITEKCEIVRRFLEEETKRSNGK